MVLGTVNGLGRESWPQAKREGFPAPSPCRQQGGQHTGRSRGPCDVVGAGETGAGGRVRTAPGEWLEVEHMRFSVSAPTDPAGCMGARTSQLDARSGAARAGDTDHGEG